MRADVELDSVAEGDKHVLGNLLQLYRYDLSEFRGYELTEHGTFVYRFLDHYWTEPRRHAFFIRVGGVLAGFALVREVDEAPSYEMAEFFVMRRHRNRKVGRVAAMDIFSRFPGRWRIFHDDANARAARFWNAVVRAAASDSFQQEAVVTGAGFIGQEYRFVVSG